MAFLAEIKNHIQSTKNTQKITQAMQLVAANKMKVFQKKAVNARRYAWSLLEGLALCHQSIETLPFAEKREKGETVFVLITSDKGLCGSLNVRMLDKIFKSEKWVNTPASERVLITIGRKGYEVALRRDIKVEKHYPEINEQLDQLTALTLVNDLIEYWTNRKVKEVVLVSTHYINPFVTIPNIKTYLPFSVDMAQDHLQWKEGSVASAQSEARVKNDLIIYEPSMERATDVLSRQLIHMLFLQAFNEFKASEYSSRMVAMKKATESADEMIHSLTLQYHKSRQSAITQQLCELAAGSEAVEMEDLVVEF